MAFNTKRGLFRLWIVLAILWFIPASYLRYDFLKPFLQKTSISFSGEKRRLTLTDPVDRDGFSKLSRPEQIRSFISSGILPADIKQQALNELNSKGRLDYSIQDEFYFRGILAEWPISLALILGPPLSLLLFGFLVAWIAAGFRQAY